MFSLVGAAVILGLVVRALLVPEGFGSDGHHRPQAPAEEAARAPIHQGKATCAECHAEQFAAHERDAHVAVPCEDCHGAAGEHVAARTAKRPPEEGRLFRKLAQANCLACHRQLIARPKLFPTIDVAAHFTKVGVKVPDTPCQSCHDPHQPLFLERPVSQARIHPLIHLCSDCHHDPTVEERELPAGHVVTFRCGDCHKELVADVGSKGHKDLACRTCHVFHADSPFSGRIHKNANPRFCLLCHLEHPFKDEDAVPLIASFEAHREEMADDDADLKKRCVDCHMESAIHALRPSSAPGAVTPTPPPTAPPTVPTEDGPPPTEESPPPTEESPPPSDPGVTP
ncbi:MAG: hypothetical protein EP329_02275 [Deltaproteobacteria bacterium]|nr:MAG: hypothetical protein EP329_02275 [Deltaproteobacteria bacterium]